MALPSIITPGPNPAVAGPTSTAEGYLNNVDSLQLHPDKDPDAIKLFVGQVPKNFEEKDLKPYLDPYGTIHELSILRDKLNLTHKGEANIEMCVCVLGLWSV